MYILLILFLLITQLYGMQSNNKDNILQLFSATETRFIDAYLQNTFNITKPVPFIIDNVCGMYKSANLQKNIASIAQILQAQASEKGFVPNFLDNLKISEYVFLYAAFLENFAQFFPKIVKVIERHCTLPLSEAMQKKLLRRFWYAHWALVLPTKVEKLYEKGIAVSSIIGQQKELLKHFRTACLVYKKPYVFKNVACAEREVSCFILCKLFSERFLMIGNEIANTKSIKTVCQKKMEAICLNGAKACDKLPGMMKLLKPWIVNSKKHSHKNMLRKKIIIYLINWWDDFWHFPYKKLKYKQKQIQQLKSDIQNIIEKDNESLSSNV